MKAFQMTGAHNGRFYLLEADILGVLPETLATHVESIFTDQSMLVGTDPTGKTRKSKLKWVGL